MYTESSPVDNHSLSYGSRSHVISLARLNNGTLPMIARRLRGLTGSPLDHKSLPAEFKSWHAHI